jgi:hypothetical protein
METIEALHWPLAQNLAYRIVTRLEDVTREENPFEKWIKVSGRLPLASIDFSTRKLAACSFKVGHNWLWEMPEIVCSEPWIIRGQADWHINANGEMCSEFDVKWQKHLAELVERYTYGLTAEYATEWLVNSTRSLLQRHLVAYRTGLTEWADDWDFWAHARDVAERQFIHEEIRRNHERGRARKSAKH